MNATLYISFLLVSTGFIIIPGPNVLVIVSTSIQHGKSQGLKTVAGTSAAMSVQLVIASIGTAWLIDSLANGFYILKWFGVCYLIILGILNFRQAASPLEEKAEVNSVMSFSKGFLISLANPKTILFFTAFLPQFVSPSAGYLPQVALLSVSFLTLAIIFDSAYALLAGKISSILPRRNLFKLRHVLSGCLYLCAGAWLAVLRRAQ